MAEKTAEKVTKTESEWKKQLTDEQYHVTREAGHRVRVHREILEHERTGDVSLRMLRVAAV